MFPFNQPEKTRDCGYRCLYYILDPEVPYEVWIDQFRFFNPTKHGITFADICTILEYYEVKHSFTQLSQNGLFLIYSGVWLVPDGKNHGHYFVYHNGMILCSTKSAPYEMELNDVVARLEAKTVEGAFRILQIR